MQRMISFLTLFICLVIIPAAPAKAWFFADNTLVTIDGEKYSTEDFKRWWTFWNTEKSPLPETPDSYVNWLLLSREGARMELDQDPGFKRQTRVYLQSRGLLKLKYEAVDSRIKVTDEQIEERYQREFVPRWLVKRLNFKDEEAALAAWGEVKAGTHSVEQIVDRDVAEGGTESTDESWIRPNGTDPQWIERFGRTEIGTLVDPDSHERGAALYYLKEKKGGDAEDLAARRERIRRDLWKEQESVLTTALLEELRIKYEVKIDNERLAAIDINAADETFTDELVVSTNRDNVSEKQFIAVIRRLQVSRPTAAHAGQDKEQAEKLKSNTVNEIIAQSLTNWESLDRHFEEREPFKWEYLFNYNHRLTLGLEQRLFASEAKVEAAQIEEFYKENAARYSQPAMAKLYIIDETQGPVDRFWADVATGKDFSKLLREHFEHRVKLQDIPVNHLDPEVKAVVDKLGKGETSPVFSAAGVRVIVHLVDLTPEQPLPLERVSNSIRTELWQKNLERLRQDYVTKLKNQSKIEIKMRAWKSLHKELGGA